MAAKELIQTITVGSGGAAAIEFTSIPQDGTDLLVVYSGRSVSAIVTADLGINLNSNTSSIYTRKNLYGTGSGVGSQSGTYGSLYSTQPGANATSNTFGNASIYIANYTGSTNKTLSIDAVNENNATESHQQIVAGIFANTGAITSLKIDGAGANLAQYSSASLYKFTKGSGGATVS